MRSCVFLACFAGALLVTVSAASAQSRYQALGPNECLNCHDHQNERTWYEKNEAAEVRRRFPQKSANAGHINSLKQLEASKSDDFAKAIGLKDKYDTAGACVKCHATVYQGDANAGVSCESCHGVASAYLKPHQTKGAYALSLGLGLVDLVGKVATWTQQCTACHVMDDQRLVTAGHPAGDDFDLGGMYGPVSLHFAKKYSENDVRAVSRDLVRAVIAKRRGTTSAAPVAASAAPAPGPGPDPGSRGPSGPQTPGSRGPSGPQMPEISATAAVVPPSQNSPDAPPALATPSPAPPPAAPQAADATIGQSPMPTSVSAAVAVVQGRLIATLTRLVQSGATVPRRTTQPSSSTAAYSGPDAALLQLQRDAIRLALDVLGEPPAPPRPR